MGDISVSTNDDYAYTGIKIIFKLISVFLLFPLMWSGGIDYYRTLFIFLFGKTIDLFFMKNKEKHFLLIVWNVFNQIIGIIACAFSFCAMVASFSKLFGLYSIQINIGLMICTITWILKDIAKFILLSIDVNFVNKG